MSLAAFKALPIARGAPRESDLCLGAGETRVCGRVTFRLAAARGFCHGVERALRIAREALQVYRDRRVLITSPILHNPALNAELRDAGVRFLSDDAGLWESLGPRDVVLLPAFGVSPRTNERLRRAGCLVVDTTCGSVVFVWKSVDRFARDGLTLVYHGRRDHEEAVATLSRLDAAPARSDGRRPPWLVVQSAAEGRVLCGFLAGEVSAGDLMARISGSCSPSFHPEADLERVGFASQTTMLAGETAEIRGLLERAMAARHGRSAAERFQAHDTVCGATQERQDALLALLDDGLDLVLVVGGYDSSNTRHLAELASATCPAYHIEGAAEILTADFLRHRPVGGGECAVAMGWLPAGSIRVGVTAGASTPEGWVEDVICRVADLAE
ncbi:MAG: 4-hydroxy-3-methylbut-2-enyl diphosphate reductase [Planctomycetes bacterium]|nr:4-hydroxy-3-methylbut-2-enyl diphosphate reductase [Planctomycetota bacterium]